VQKNLDTLFKELRLDDVVKAVEFSRRAGVKTLGSFMFGIPGETFEDALETIKFASSIPLDYVYFGYFTPFPGTKAFEDIAKNPSTGKIIPGAKFDLKNITYLPSSMTEKELRILPGIALRKFYFRLTFILKKLLQIRSFEDIKNYANAFFNLSSY
jgi:radical SAM superfamily enzyme YgiQ (UPF0313 family)